MIEANDNSASAYRGASLRPIGKRVKMVREALGMAQKDFAINLNIAPSYLSQIERGNKNNPAVAVFLKIALQYDVSLDYLLRGTGDMFLPATAKTGNRQREYVDKIETIDDLVWFLENSSFFKNVIMGFAFKLLCENEDIIKRSLEQKNKRKEENTEGENES